VAQQRPSVEQNPLAQSAPIMLAAHVCPSTLAQVCMAVHAWFWGHAPCSPSANIEQVFPSLHDWHGPSQRVAQQKPSDEQNPLAQSAPCSLATHTCPLGASHVPAALQTEGLVHRPCAPAGNDEQVPSPHDWHGPLHAVAQQIPSLEQNPVSQSALATHGFAVSVLQTCAALQTWPATQSRSTAQGANGSVLSKAPHAASMKPRRSTATNVRTALVSRED
jgi:hypothetical protein